LEKSSYFLCFPDATPPAGRAQRVTMSCHNVASQWNVALQWMSAKPILSVGGAAKCPMKQT